MELNMKMNWLDRGIVEYKVIAMYRKKGILKMVTNDGWLWAILIQEIGLNLAKSEGSLHESFLKRINEVGPGGITHYRKSKVEILTELEVKQILEGKEIYNVADVLSFYMSQFQVNNPFETERDLMSGKVFVLDIQPISP